MADNDAPRGARVLGGAVALGRVALLLRLEQLDAACAAARLAGWGRRMAIARDGCFDLR